MFEDIEKITLENNEKLNDSLEQKLKDLLEETEKLIDSEFGKSAENVEGSTGKNDESKAEVTDLKEEPGINKAGDISFGSCSHYCSTEHVVQISGSHFYNG